MEAEHEPEVPAGTALETKYEILSELWIEYRDEPALAGLFEYADLSFPIAFAVVNGMAGRTERADDLATEAFDILCDMTGVDDAGFDNLDELFAAGELDLEPEQRAPARKRLGRPRATLRSRPRWTRPARQRRTRQSERATKP